MEGGAIMSLIESKSFRFTMRGERWLDKSGYKGTQSDVDICSQSREDLVSFEWRGPDWGAVPGNIIVLSGTRHPDQTLDNTRLIWIQFFLKS